MPTEIAMRREGSHLVPVDPVSAEMLAEIPSTKDVMVTVKVPRNLRQFRLAWALADIVAKSVDFLHDREDSMTWLKIKARHVKFIHDPLRNTTAVVPKSIAFASLDQAEFARVLNRMIYVTTTEIIPGLDVSALKAELESIVGIESAPEPAPAAKPRARKAKAEPESEVMQSAGAISESNQPDTSPAAEQDQPPPGDQQRKPETEEQYQHSCRRWFAAITDPSKRWESKDYFNGEKHVAMRQAIGVSLGMRKSLERELDAHFDQLEKGKTDGGKA